MPRTQSPSQSTVSTFSHTRQYKVKETEGGCYCCDGYGCEEEWVADDVACCPCTPLSRRHWRSLIHGWVGRVIRHTTTRDESGGAEWSKREEWRGVVWAIDRVTNAWQYNRRDEVDATPAKVREKGEMKSGNTAWQICKSSLLVQSRQWRRRVKMLERWNERVKR